MELDDSALVDGRGKLLERAVAHTRREVALGTAAVLVALIATYGVLPLGYALAWGGIALFAYGARFAAAAQAASAAGGNDDAAALRSPLFITSLLATGLSWGALTALLVFREGLAVAAPVLVLTCAATVASLGAQAGAVPMGVINTLAAMLPPLVALLTTRGAAEIWSAVGIVALAATLVLGARELAAQLREAVALRARDVNLMSYLDQRREQVERLTVELKTTQGKREEAEVNLRRTSADLGLAQGKAKALADTLERISPTCQVTGLYNRRHFDQAMESEWRRCARENRVIALCVVDVDDFDEYLDTYGRQSADALLKRIATGLKACGHRAGDTGGRYADTKLALLLPGCDARNANRIAEGLRKRIEGQSIPHARARNRDVVTVHMGVAMIKPTRSLQSAELLKRVDTAVYEARFQGGNRVIVYQPLSKLRVERWELNRDGPLNDQSLMQKLLVWGYDTTKLLLRPGVKVEPELVGEDKVLAIATGELGLEVEGHTMSVKPGDCVFIPKGVEMSLEVIGERPVVKYMATKTT